MEAGVALGRGKGEDRQVQPVGPPGLPLILYKFGENPTPFAVMVWRLSIVGCFFMMRSDEVLHIRRKHATGSPRVNVTILIATSLVVMTKRIRKRKGYRDL